MSESPKSKFVYLTFFQVYDEGVNVGHGYAVYHPDDEEGPVPVIGNDKGEKLPEKWYQLVVTRTVPVLINDTVH